MAVLVALYTRVSREDAEEPQSTRRQEQACREFAQSKGWEVVRVFEDVDVSAYDRRVQRPAFTELLRVVASGQVNGILVWKLDRLARRPSDFERFWDRCERAGVFLTSATEPIDSGNEMGLAIIRMLINFANVESTSISLRIRAKMREQAVAGIPLWKTRAFGFNDDATATVASEVALIQEAADRVVAGESLTDIAADWRRRLVSTAPGTTPWQPRRLANILKSHRLVGDNEFKGEVVAKDCFPAILDRLIHSQVRAALADRYRPSTKSPPALLAGLLLCGACGSKLYGSHTKRVLSTGTPVRYPIYRCPTNGCGHVHINALFVERLITEAVLCRIEGRRASNPASTVEAPNDASEGLKAAYDRYTTCITELTTDYFIHRRITRHEWLATRHGLENQLEQARRHFDPLLQSRIRQREGPPIPFRREWPTMALAHQRDVIASELEAALVHPTNHRAFFDARRVEPRWNGAVEEPGSEYPWPNGGRTRQRPWLDPNEMLADEVADSLGISVALVRVRLRSGELHATKVGHNWRFDRSEVEDYASRVKGALGTSQVAAMLGVSKGDVAYWIKRGSIPATKAAGKYHIKPDQLTTWGRELGRLISADDAANRLGVTRYWLKRLIEAGQLHALSHGEAKKFLDKSEVIALQKVRRDVRDQLDKGTPVQTGEVMSMAQVVRALECSPKTLRKLVRDGAFPTLVKSQGQYRFGMSDFRRAQRLIASKKARGRAAAFHRRGHHLALEAG